MYEEFLARVPLFQDLSRRERLWLAETCHERTYAEHALLVEQGKRATGLFIVLVGTVRITQRSERGAKRGVERTLGELEVGAAYGECALLEEAPAHVTLTAAEPTRALVLPIWDFRETLRDYPDLGIHLLAVLSQCLRAQVDASREGRWLPDIW
jgi:CRP-like cAMP-binding protein